MKKRHIISKYSNKYTFSTFLRMSYSFLMTKLFWRKARIVVYPVYAHGKKRIKYGQGLMLGHNCRIDAINDEKDTLFIGNNCDFGNYCHISAVCRVVIGDNFLCGDSVFICDSSHGLYSFVDGAEESDPFISPKKRVLIGSEVIIGNNVWVGEKASILPGVVIGDNVVIGANSVVTSDIPSNVISAGNPCKIIKRFDTKTKRWVKYE